MYSYTPINDHYQFYQKAFKSQSISFDVNLHCRLQYGASSVTYISFITRDVAVLIDCNFPAFPESIGGVYKRLAMLTLAIESKCVLFRVVPHRVLQSLEFPRHELINFQWRWNITATYFIKWNILLDAAKRSSNAKTSNGWFTNICQFGFILSFIGMTR